MEKFWNLEVWKPKLNQNAQNLNETESKTFSDSKFFDTESDTFFDTKFLEMKRHTLTGKK